MTDCVCCAQRDAGPGRQACPPCGTRVRLHLDEIPELYAEIELVPGTGARGPAVSGSRERQLPLNVQALDLTMPWRAGVVRDPYGDQTGELSVASVLDAWVTDWIADRGQRESRPLPTVTRLAGWLSDRLDDAVCDYPALSDFADEISRLASVLRGVLGLRSLKADVTYRDGVPCPGCDQCALTQTNGSLWTECGGCGHMLSVDEYAQWVKDLNEVRDAA